MAVIESLPGVVVSVTVNGAALQEYDDDEFQEDSNTTTRWIEAVEGQVFCLTFNLSSTARFLGDAMHFYVYLDGKRMKRVFITQSEVGQHGHTAVVDAVRCSETHKVHLAFSSLHTVEDGREQEPAGVRLEDIGTISVKVHHYQDSRLVPRTKKAKANSIQSVQTVSEKVLKGRSVSHCVSFEGVAPAAPLSKKMWISKHVDPEKQPAAVYNFRYRSRDALRSMLVIPPSREQTPARSSSPPPLTKRDPNSLSQAEVAEMQRRLNEFENHAKGQINVKREQDENSSRRRKARKSGKVTIIELDDDGEIVSQSLRSRTATPDAAQLVKIE